MTEYRRILKLRPYQKRALNQIITKLNSPHASALFVGPTGCGKTEIITGLMIGCHSEHERS
jgi:superfamily II DNA or RNA helicase